MRALAGAVAPFDEGHREFSALSPLLWQPLGRALAERAEPAVGDRVLDACCGDGASAIPAALAVGDSGRVDAVDGAGALIEQGRAVVGSGLPQLRFYQGDVTTWHSGDGPYDLVQCGYGVFLLPDMDADSKRMVSLLTDGGRFAVSAWKFPALRQFAACLIESVEEELGEPLPKPSSLQPAERIDSQEKLGRWLESIGLTGVRTWDVPFEQTLAPELAWLMVTGTGFRGMLGRFDRAGVERVRIGLLRRIEERELRVLAANSVVGVGTHQ